MGVVFGCAFASQTKDIFFGFLDANADPEIISFSNRALSVVAALDCKMDVLKLTLVTHLFGLGLYHY